MRQPMVVVQILPALDNGGVERGTIELANYLVSQGHQSIVVSNGGAMQVQLADSVKHIALNVGKKSLLSLLLINKLKQIFLDFKVDVVHARSRLPAWLAYKAIKKIKLKKPLFVTTIHGLYSVKRYSSIMARGDKVIAVSDTALKYLTHNYAAYLKSKPITIYRGINPKAFPYHFKPDLLWLQNWYKKHPSLVGHKTVLLPGRLTTLKGAQELLPWLLNTENDAKLMLTANPENDLYAARLNHWFKQQGLENRIVWVGIQSNMAALYSIADVVVSTSIRPESFGRTVVEALAIGTAVVGYNHGGVGELLSQLFPHGLVKPLHKEQLAQTINQTLQKQPKVPDNQPFLLETMLEKTLALYAELMHEH